MDIVIVIAIIAVYAFAIIKRLGYRAVEKQALDLFWQNVANTAYLRGLEEGSMSSGKTAKDILSRSLLTSYYEPFKEFSDKDIKETIDDWNF